MTQRTRLLSNLFCSTLLCVGAALPARAQPPIQPGPIYRTISPEAVATQMDGLSLVTLDVKDATVQSVLDEIAKQTGFQLKAFQGEAAAVRPVTLKLDRQPFWLAIKALTRQSGANYFRVSTLNARKEPDVMMSLGASNENFKGISLSQGPFMLVANSLQRTTTTKVNFEANQDADATTDNARVNGETYANLTFSLFNDPKLASLTGGALIDVETAVDENGRSLKSSRGYSYYSPSLSARTLLTQRLSANLTLPPGVGTRIAKLGGAIYLYQALKTETWEIPNALAAPHVSKTISSNGQTKIYSFEGITKTGNDYEVNFRVNADSNEESPAMADAQGRPRRTHNSIPSLRLVDSAETPLARGGTSSSSSGGNMSLKLRFSNRQLRPDQDALLDGPLKLVIEIPTDLIEIKMPFEFTDLPLS